MSGNIIQNRTVAPPFSMQSADLPGMLSKQILRICWGYCALPASNAPHNSWKMVHGCILPRFAAIIAQMLSMGL